MSTPAIGSIRLHDKCSLNLTARDMFRRVGTYWHLFPEQAQARRAIWNGIDRAGRRIIDQMLPPGPARGDADQDGERVNLGRWRAPVPHVKYDYEVRFRSALECTRDTRPLPPTRASSSSPSTSRPRAARAATHSSGGHG
jgi:hypothetical protein